MNKYAHGDKEHDTQKRRLMIEKSSGDYIGNKDYGEKHKERHGSKDEECGNIITHNRYDRGTQKIEERMVVLKEIRIDGACIEHLP